MSNVSDDWNEYWKTCDDCGHRWHSSEGSECEVCIEERKIWLEDHCMECQKEFTKEDYPFDITINGEEGYVCAECQYEIHH